MKKMIYISLFASSLLVAQEDVESLKEQLKTQEKMISELMQRLDRMEQAQEKNTYREELPIEVDSTMAPTRQVASSFSQNAYLPDISLIINSSAVSRNIDNTVYGDYEIPGFVDAGTAEIPFNKERGFNLNYAELAISSAVDPYFDAFAIFHMQAAQFEIEEAYVSTRDMPYGLKVKAGKFKSAIGRINEKHQHAWNFSTQPLVYSAFFGPEGINDPGVQLQWVAPADTYLMVGIEAMQGTNAQSFGYEKGNSLYNSYIKSSLDVTDATTVLAGVSLLHGKNPEGNSDIYAAELTLQMQLSSYSALTWQSEYLHRELQGDISAKNQDGMYTELVYKYNQNYSAGVRYDTLFKNSVGPNDLDIYTAMLEYSPFEFSRLRLEYSHDRSKYYTGEQKNVDQILLELNIAVGAHGAHSY